MKRSTLVFVLILFAACAVAGYLIASKTNFDSSKGNQGSDGEATALASSQQNFLLVRVDDLTADSPKLVEAWLVLTLYSDPPQVMFIPIYPRYDASQNSTLASSFALDDSHSLAGKMSSKVSEMFGVKIDGYILTDTVGMNAFVSWFGIDNVVASSVPPASDNDKHATLLTSQIFLQNICQQLKHGDAMKEYESIRWSQLLPYHFHTGLSFEQLSASWDRVNSASPLQKCDVLSNE